MTKGSHCRLRELQSEYRASQYYKGYMEYVGTETEAWIALGIHP